MGFPPLCEERAKYKRPNNVVRAAFVPPPSSNPPPPLLHRAPFVLAIKKERQRRKVAKRKGGEAQRRGERNHRRKTMLLFGRNEEQGTPLSGKKAKKHTQTTHSERKEASRQKGKAAHTHTARIQIVYGNGTQRRARGITSLLTAPRTPQE